MGEGRELYSKTEIKGLDTVAGEEGKVKIQYVILSHEPLKRSANDIRGSVT